MRKHLVEVIQYFAHFSYAPTFDEIFTFFPVKTIRKTLLNLVSGELKQKKLIKLSRTISFGPFPGSATNYVLRTTHSRYTLPQYSMRAQSKVKSQKSKGIGRILQIYIHLLKSLPLVRFVGITGKSAVEGVRNDDDIDLFIVTKRGLLWTTRFVVVLLAKLLKIHGGNGVCLNLFFDEKDLTIPLKKQNEYIAHELLQMKPIIDKGNTYGLLMEANKWVFSLFPNSRRQKLEVRSKNSNIFCLLSSVFLLLESLMRLLQLPIIRKNKTGFRVTPTQLWLFRSDFEKKLKRNRLVE